MLLEFVTFIYICCGAFAQASDMSKDGCHPSQDERPIRLCRSKIKSGTFGALLPPWFSFSEVKIGFEMSHCVSVGTAGTVRCC